MSTFKKLLALTLALAMVLSVSAFAGYKADTYKDAAGIDEDCEDAIELLYALDIMKGDANGNFNPTATITRAEVAKMIYVILNYGKDDKAVTYTGAKMFSDVPAGAWYEGYVNYAAATKLVQGRGNGTFGPNDPVTCAEAAKMLLTAIGYSAEARGYTGANWAKNVLSDAAILGLLDGYKYNTNTYAPRQWVAVMFQNALGCYTFNTMVPSFNGLLISGSDDYKGYDTMGGKYYGLRTFTGYLYATEYAYIDQVDYTDNNNRTQTTTYADEDCVIFTTGKKDKLIEVENPGLGYMDLGQQFKVIYNDDGDVYSARNTGKSQVGESAKKDISYEIVRGTYANEANNKYQFTIGDLVAKFNSDGVKMLKVNVRNSRKVSPDSNGKLYDANDLVRWLPENVSELFHAVDKDGNGTIDYLIVKEYSYAQVTKVAEHKSYGEYFTADGTDGNAFKAIGFKAINSNSATTQWYLDDVVNTEDTIEKGNVIKVVYNPDNGKYDIEVLPVAEGVTYEKKSASKGIYTLGGEEYLIAEDGWKENNTRVLNVSNLKDEMDVAYDDNLIVLVKPVDSDYDNLDDINAQLVMVTDAYSDHYNYGSNRMYIDYMTIDGEEHEEVRYVDGKHGTLDDGQTLDPDDADVNFAELVTTETGNGKTAGYLDNHQRLFVLVESGNGVYLKKLTAANAQGILDYSSSLLDGYREDTDDLDTEDDKFGSDFVNNENLFFVSYMKSGTMRFDVLSLDDLGEGVAENSFIQGLYKTKRETDTYLAGHIYINGLNLNQKGGYVYFTSDMDQDITSYDDGEYAYEVTGFVFADGYTPEEDYILVEQNAASADLKANCLYSYTYELTKDKQRVFTLELIDETVDAPWISKDGKTLAAFDHDGSYVEGYSEIKDNGSSKLIVKDGSGDLVDIKVYDDTVVALKTVYLNTTVSTGRHDDPDAIEEVNFGFITFDELVAETDGEYDNFIAGGTTTDYVYISDYYAKGSTEFAKADDVLYVVVYAFMNDAND